MSLTTFKFKSHLQSKFLFYSSEPSYKSKIHIFRTESKLQLKTLYNYSSEIPVIFRQRINPKGTVLLAVLLYLFPPG